MATQEQDPAKPARASKARTAKVARDYFEQTINDRDLSSYDRLWHPDGTWEAKGVAGPTDPQGAAAFWSSMFEAMPDLRVEVLEVVAEADKAVVNWRMTATFAGPGTFQGLAPTGARVELEGADLLRVRDGRISSLVGYVDNLAVAQQLGLVPPTGSAAEAKMKQAFNARTKVGAKLAGAPEKVAEGVWVLRGGFPAKTMNVYVIEDPEGGVTVFDAGIKAMTKQVAAFGAQLGGINRVVLGHADADHRGTAPRLGAPVLCHPLEVEAARDDNPYRPYMDRSKLGPLGRLGTWNFMKVWDGGAVEIAGTVAEGDEVSGFRVIELPGHAPGLIGLWRESDRVALVSDCFYVLDPQTGRPKPPSVPHPAFDHDVEQARASIRKLAALDPLVAAPGHLGPVTGDVRAQLERAADAPL